MADIITLEDIKKFAGEKEIVFPEGVVITQGAGDWANSMGIRIKLGNKLVLPTKRLVISVLGEDKVGIIAAVSNVLADHNVNILDINQTLLQEFFAMIMVVDASDCTISYEKLKDILGNKGKDIGVRIDVQDEDVFRFMHRV